MVVRSLEESPSLGELYAKALLPALPGASRLRRSRERSRPDDTDTALPHVGDDTLLPDLAVRLPGITIDPAHLARYAEVCGFAVRRAVPTTYPHVLAFPLQLVVMTDAAFPFPVMGLVHISNRIVQRRPLTEQDVFDLHVHAEQLQPHPRGTQLTLVSEALVDGVVVWRDETVVLRRHPTSGDLAGTSSTSALPEHAPSGPIRWRLHGGLGRRYASVSGDRNPIHLSSLSARAFGFPRAIAHGMWTKAKCLATLEQRVPPAATVEVAFKKPIQLPGQVAFGARMTSYGLDFGVTSGDDRTHLVGRLTAC